MTLFGVSACPPPPPPQEATPPTSEGAPSGPAPPLTDGLPVGAPPPGADGGPCQSAPAPGTTGLSPASGTLSGKAGTPFTAAFAYDVPASDVVDLSSVTGVPSPPSSQTILYVEVAVAGLPPGLSATCAPSSCRFVAETRGCVLISGTPTAPGKSALRVDVMVTRDLSRDVPALGGSSFTSPPTSTTYPLVIAP